MTTSYVGSGPYCYANSVAMVLGAEAPSPAQIEVLTGSPFGMQLLEGRMPVFDPYGWDPDIGIDAALGLLGWECRRAAGGDAETALDMLCAAADAGPVLVGPVEMGLLRHQPGMTAAIGADHWVVVLEIDEETVLMHDPHGHPYATLPTGDFMAAWRAEQMPWADPPFVMRTDFVKVREVDVDDAVRASLPSAVRWLSDDFDGPVPPGTLGTSEALERLAAMTEAGLPADLRGHLLHFAIRVGARRLSDAATALARIGEAEGAAIAADQARTLGSLQYDLVVGDDHKAAATMRKLAPSYANLAASLR
jgi:hypothetical protein